MRALVVEDEAALREGLRDQLAKRGFPVADLADDQLRGMMEQFGIIFRDNAPTTAAQAAQIILDGVRKNEWRILVGEDAKTLDRMVRASPENAYEHSFMQALQATGHLRMGG